MNCKSTRSGTIGQLARSGNKLQITSSIDW